ncbi:hypothetical protein B1218_37695, partial [Pseudomonas ogarae]
MARRATAGGRPGPAAATGRHLAGPPAATPPARRRASKGTGVARYGSAHSAFSYAAQKQICEGLGNRMPHQVPLSHALARTKMALKGHVGFLTCDRLNQHTSSQPRIPFCKLTLNDQLLI